MKRRQTLVWIALATGVLATVGALVASEHPDGLERVAEDLHFAEQGETPLVGAPAPDYVLMAPGVEHPAAQTALAGLGGAAVVALAALALGYGLRRRRKP